MARMQSLIAQLVMMLFIMEGRRCTFLSFIKLQRPTYNNLQWEQEFLYFRQLVNSQLCVTLRFKGNAFTRFINMRISQILVFVSLIELLASKLMLKQNSTTNWFWETAFLGLNRHLQNFWNSINLKFKTCDPLAAETNRICIKVT